MVREYTTPSEYILSLVNKIIKVSRRGAEALRERLSFSSSSRESGIIDAQIQ